MHACICPKHCGRHGRIEWHGCGPHRSGTSENHRFWCIASVHLSQTTSAPLSSIKSSRSIQGHYNLARWHFSKVFSREGLSRTVHCDVLYGNVCRICLIEGESSSGRLSGNFQGLSSFKSSLLRQDLTPRWRHQQEEFELRCAAYFHRGFQGWYKILHARLRHWGDFVLRAGQPLCRSTAAPFILGLPNMTLPG